MFRGLRGTSVALAIGFTAALAVSAPSAQAQDAPSAPKTAQQKEAEQHFVRARQLYEEGDFPLALVEFTRAHDLSPNYRVLYNIGQVNIQLNNYAAARVALERYVKDGGTDIPAARKTQVEADLKMLEGRTAYVKVTTTPAGADIFFDELALGKAPFDEAKLVNGGSHKVTASKEGYVSQTTTLTLAGGDRKDLDFKLLEASKDKSVVIVPTTTQHKNYTPAMIGWIGTGVVGIAAGIVGGFYLSEEAEIERLSKPGTPIELQTKNDAEQSATRLAVTADVLGLVAIGAGLVSLYLTLRPPQTVSTTVTTGSNVRIRPTGNGVFVSF